MHEKVVPIIMGAHVFISMLCYDRSMDNIFAKRLKELRLAKGWTQVELARKVGVVRTVISDWERSRSEPRIERFLKLQSVLGVTCDYLIGLED